MQLPIATTIADTAHSKPVFSNWGKFSNLTLFVERQIYKRKQPWASQSAVIVHKITTQFPANMHGISNSCHIYKTEIVLYIQDRQRAKETKESGRVKW